MKIMRLRRLFSLLAFLMLLAVPEPQAAWNATDGVYYLKTSDGLEDTYTVSGSITFKSQSGNLISGYRDCGVVFAPANPGEVIQVTVNSIDLDGGNYLLAYDGAIEQIKSGTSDGKDQSSYLPAGWKKKFVKGMEGETYTSASADGKLSFGFHSGAANSQKGFIITVESVSLKDMEFVSAEVFAPTSVPRRGEKAAKLTGVRVVADGSSNPLSVEEMTIDCSAAAASSSVSDIRLERNGETVATLAEGQTRLRLENASLRSGKNDFYVVADVSPDASGNVPVPSVVSLTVGGQSRTTEPSSVSSGDFADIIWMPSEHQIFTVSAPLDFFDDGGPDGKISEKFEGTVTFVPATEGQAVKIDFTKMEIFNTSSTGMNDVLTVYNGREADDANLIATLLKEPEVVKSTAADGSLTVKLVSKTGNPAQGWEAKVTQFLPGDMTISSVIVSKADDATVYASQKNAPVMFVDVIADNTANPMSATSFAVNVENQNAISGVKVWYLGKKAEMDSKQEFGTAAVNAASVSVEGGRELAEGHNWFVITADVAPDALNDAAFSLSLASVTVGAASRIPEETLNAAKTVRNVWRSKEGNNTVPLYDSWQFLPTMNGTTGYSDRYAAGQTDQTVTFVPANEGEKTQIDFSKFQLTYTGSVNARFEIYSGRTCDESALIWKLAKSDDKNIGPGKTLRSTAEDGSMTIRFNPNTSSNYYCAQGWEAIVKPFMNHDMTIIESTARRGNTREMPIGATDQEMLDFGIVTEGTLSVKTLKSVKLSVDGAAALSSVKVMTSLNEDMSDAVLFGETTDVKAETVVGGELPLAEGPRYFRVFADIDPEAEAETAVRVGVVSLTDASGNTDMVADGNPEGSRTVKSILYLETGTHTVTVSQPLMWYDDGGADGKISSRISATYTFVPSREGYAVTLNSTQFSIGNGKMYVYSGREADKNALLGSQTGYGTTTGPKNIVSKAADGSVTVVVTGPSGSTLDGFAIEVGLHEKVDYTLAGVTAGAVSSDVEYLRGSRELPLVKVVAEVAGDKGASRMSDLKFSLAGTDNIADITALHLYYGAANDGFSPAICEKIATVTPTSTEVNFETEEEIGDNGMYYYYLTADIADEAQAGNKITVRLSSVDFNGIVKECVSAAVEGTVKAGLKGTFTIGASGADYADFKTATQALAQGVEGPVTFEILDGTYTENLKITDVKGSSAEHPVVFRSKSGNRDAVRITGKYVAEDKDGIVQVKGSPYVCLEKISVEAGSQSFSNVVYVGEKSPGFMMTGCSVAAAPVTSGYSGINLVRSHAINEAGGNNDFMTIENSSFEGGVVGLYLGGTGYVALPKEKGLVVRGNTVNGCYSKGIYVSDENAPVIEGNTVSWSGAKKGYQAMDLYRVTNGAVISGNRIYNTGAAYSTGVDFRDDCVGTQATPIRFFNNEIVLTKSDAYSGRCLNIKNTSACLEIFYNTLRAAGSNSYVMATNGAGTPQGIRLNGNILQNECSAISTVIYFWNKTDIEGFDFGFNSYWSKSGVVCKNDSENLDAAGFESLTGDNTFVSTQAQFLSETDSHLLESGDLRCGTPVVWISTDIEGNSRPASADWTLGAYEYMEINMDAPQIAEGYPSVASVTDSSASVRTRWDMNGTLYAVVKKWSEGDVLPDAAEVMKSTGTPVLADVEVLSAFTSLEASTAYRAFFVAVSSAGTPSEVKASEAFTTLRHIDELTLLFDTETPRVQAGDTYVIVPGVGGGDEPYTYTWTDQMNRVVGSGSTLAVNPEVSQYYTLKVVSADGQEAVAKTAVEVTGDMAVATFDDNFVAEESHIAPATTKEHFYSGSFAFNAGGMPQYSYWYGYALTSESSSEYTGLSDQFRSAPGGAFEGNNFAVGYPEGMTVDVTNSLDGDVIPGLYVANSAYTISSMRNGDGFAKKFEQGDWLKLTATGTTAEGTSVSKDFYLADMRDSRTEEHYILDSWEWLDLRSLGKVKNVRFTFDGSDSGKYGLNTPKYFCMDLFGTMPLTDLRKVSIPDGGYVDLSDYFSEDSSIGAEAVYSIEVPEGLPFTLSLSGSRLSLSHSATRAESMDEGECLVSMRQKGKTQYLRLAVSEDKTSVGVTDVNADEVRLYPVPVQDRLNVSTDLDRYSVEIISSTGTVVYRAADLSGSSVIDRDGWASGIYLVRITSADNSIVRRIMIR